ncbi:thiol reductant ABC exporter subunit CydC [Parafrankia sp. FMc2]|uniref:thiol reductant ABC exporter subunit CydC n=1 Tax=Parafrankia sp. FMc2 TaxID=3233196 RepID=UPI0034D6A3DC
MTELAPDTELAPAAEPEPAETAAAGRGARLRPLVALLRPHRGIFAVAVTAGVAHQLATLGAAATGAWLVGRAVTGSPGSELRTGIAVLAVLAVAAAVLAWTETQLAHVGAFRVLATVRGMIYDAFERLAPGGLQRRRTGDLGASAISDVEQLEGFFAHTLSPVVVAATVPPTALVTLAVMRWELAVALIPALVGLLTVPRWLRRRSEATATQLRHSLGELSADVVDTVQGVRELLAHNAGERALNGLAEREGDLSAAKAVHGRRAGTEQAVTDLLSFVGLVAVLATAAHLVSAGELPRHLLSVAVVLALAAFVPIFAVVDTTRELDVILAAAARIESILTAEAPVEDRATTAPALPAAPDVTFERVSFRYPGAGVDAVADVSFTVTAGETVALVGHSGAGKSTCAHLLMRFWDVASGCVLVGGHDVRDLPQAMLREAVTHVPQDVHLFNLPVRENIRLARPDATDADVERAARDAGAHGFIVALPEGYDTAAGELGALLSGGQRQRIAIARALLRDAPVVVLDEAVSNLDAHSEVEVAAALTRLRRGRATLVIAHRLSTIRGADRLVVLDCGRVVATGSHDELIARGGTYLDLISTQVDFAEEDG